MCAYETRVTAPQSYIYCLHTEKSSVSDGEMDAMRPLAGCKISGPDVFFCASQRSERNAEAVGARWGLLGRWFSTLGLSGLGRRDGSGCVEA